MDSVTDPRRSLLSFLWKVMLATSVVAALISLTGALADWGWLSFVFPRFEARRTDVLFVPLTTWPFVPLMWGSASLLTWLNLRRDRYDLAAWCFVVVNEITIVVPQVLSSGGGSEGATLAVLFEGLPFANLILITLAGILLPSWSAVVLLAVQVIVTIVVPLFLGADIAAMRTQGVALLLSAAGAVVAWKGLGSLLATVDMAMTNYREAERRAEKVARDRDELSKSLEVRTSLNERLRQVNEELARQTAQLEAAVQVSRLITSALAIDEMLTLIAEVVQKQFGAFAALFVVGDRDGPVASQVVLQATSTSPTALPLTKGDGLQVNAQTAVGACVIDREPRILTDVTTGVTLLDHLLPGTRSEVCCPLISRDREVVGVLDLQSPQTGAFGEGHLVALTAIADQIAFAIANARSFTETRQALQEVSRLQRRYVREAWERFAPQLEAAGYQYAEGDITPLSHRPLPEVSETISVGHTVVEPEKGVIAPISFRGQVIGALGLRDPDGSRQWTAQDVNLIESVARQMSVVIDNARLVEETQQSLAEITELNRRYMREAWEEFLPQHGQEEFVFVQPGVSPEPLPRELDQVWALADTRQDERGRTTGMTVARTVQASLQEGEKDGSESTLLAPINLRKQIVGALGLQETVVPREWTEDELELVGAVADQMSWAIENARLFEETERRAYELERTAEQLRQTDQFRAQFLANMSHELRTPLNSIIGFSRVILKGIDGPLTELQQTDLEAIYSNGQHLLNLINEILDMSKIEAGKMELVIENVDLNVLIRGIISTSKSLVKDKPIDLRTDIEEDLPVMRADGTRIRQVITNLMSNASKFTSEGAITFSVRTDKEMVYVSVADTGEGIPEEKIPLVFDAFRQVDGSSTRRAEGTGLGLPISREFVEMHGGRIWLESEYGAGSTFTFCVPIEGPIEVVAELVDLQIDEDKRLLLVVERDESELDAYWSALTTSRESRTGIDAEYQLVGLYDGQHALRWARYLRPWAILVEVEVDGEADWSTLESLKSMRATRDYPVIVCSELDQGGQAISMGAVAYLSKPIEALELAGVLDRLRDVRDTFG